MRNVGFYPSGIVSPNNPNSPGILRNNAGMAATLYRPNMDHRTWRNLCFDRRVAVWRRRNCLVDS